MARVLWIGDAGCTTGFGTASHGIGDRLVTEYGHDVHALAINYLGDHWETPMKLYVPTLRERADIYGQGRYVEMMSKILPDVVVFVNDPYVVLRLLFKNKRDTEFVMARVAPVLAYMPVDGTNFPASWAKLPALVSSLKPWQEGMPEPSLTPVVMSKHGHNLFPGAPLIPHGIDTRVFRPISDADPLTMSTGDTVTNKTDIKRVLGLPEDAKMIVRVDRNSARKNYTDTYRALVPLMKRDPTIHVWFQCKADGDEYELSQVVQRDLEIADRFHWPAEFSTYVGWNVNDLVAIYNMADVFVSTSWGEGFGLTLGEAAACGVPIVAQNVSSIPEVVGPGGILLEPERMIASPSGQDQWLPDVAAFTAAIDLLLNDEAARHSLGEAGRKHVTDTFSWDDAARRFHELINDVVQKASGHTTADTAGGVS